MIGGFILDATALRMLATGGPYMVARAVVAVEQVQALYVPSTALAAALSSLDLPPRRREEFEHALYAPTFTFGELDRTTALAVADLSRMGGVDLATAHAAHMALRRPGLPVLTAQPAELHKVHPGIEVEELP